MASSRPRLVNPDGTLQPTLRRLPTVLGAFAEAVLGGRLADRLGVGELVFTEAGRTAARARLLGHGCGAADVVDRARSLGPWDESFLLYSEETEYMLRAADRGWITWYEPAAVVEHRGGESGTHPGLAALLRRQQGAAVPAAPRGDIGSRVYGVGDGGRGAALQGGGGSGRPPAPRWPPCSSRSRRITSLAQLR